MKSKTSSRKSQRKNFEDRLPHTVPAFRATPKLSRGLLHLPHVRAKPTAGVAKAFASPATRPCRSPTISISQTSASLVIFVHFQRRLSSFSDVVPHANHKRCSKGLPFLLHVRVHLFSSSALRPSETSSFVFDEGLAKAPVLPTVRKETRPQYHRTQQPAAHQSAESVAWYSETSHAESSRSSSGAASSFRNPP